MPVYKPPKGTDDDEQYRRLVTLASADMLRRGFTESAVEAFLDKRCGVPFSMLLEVSETPSHEMWIQTLEYAKAECDDAKKRF